MSQKITLRGILCVGAAVGLLALFGCSSSEPEAASAPPPTSVGSGGAGQPAPSTASSAGQPAPGTTSTGAPAPLSPIGRANTAGQVDPDQQAALAKEAASEGK